MTRGRAIGGTQMRHRTAAETENPNPVPPPAPSPASDSVDSPTPPPASVFRRGRTAAAVVACLKSGPKRYIQICDAVGCNPGNMSRLLRELVRGHLVVKGEDGAYRATGSAAADPAAVDGALLSYLSEPRRLHDVVSYADAPRGTVKARVEALVAAGAAVKVGRGTYAAAPSAAAGPPPPGCGPRARRPNGGRAQPVRDAIMAFLVEPRRAKEVAGRIGRSVPNATGHLSAMRKRGLVVRLGHGLYGRADLHTPSASTAPAAPP